MSVSEIEIEDGESLASTTVNSKVRVIKYPDESNADNSQMMKWFILKIKGTGENKTIRIN